MCELRKGSKERIDALQYFYTREIKPVLLLEKTKYLAWKWTINYISFSLVLYEYRQCQTGTRRVLPDTRPNPIISSNTQTRPNPIISSNTQTRPEIFSELSGIFGYRVFEKSDIFVAKIYKYKILSQKFTNTAFLSRNFANARSPKVCEIFCGPQKAANFCHTGPLWHKSPNTCLLTILIK